MARINIEFELILGVCQRQNVELIILLCSNRDLHFLSPEQIKDARLLCHQN